MIYNILTGMVLLQCMIFHVLNNEREQCNHVRAIQAANFDKIRSYHMLWS